MLSKEQQAEFRALTIQLVTWMRKNSDPHAMIVVDQNSAQLMSGELSTGMIPHED